MYTKYKRDGHAGQPPGRCIQVLCFFLASFFLSFLFFDFSLLVMMMNFLPLSLSLLDIYTHVPVRCLLICDQLSLAWPSRFSVTIYTAASIKVFYSFFSFLYLLGFSYIICSMFHPILPFFHHPLNSKWPSPLPPPSSFIDRE